MQRKRAHLILHTAALAGGLLVAAATARADVSIKRNIIDNCTAALAQLETLPQNERATLVPYLRLVLRMELDTDLQQRTGPVPFPFEMPTPAGPGGGFAELPFEDQKVPHLWRSFDPTAEKDAKECAIRVMDRLGL